MSDNVDYLRGVKQQVLRETSRQPRRRSYGLCNQQRKSRNNSNEFAATNQEKKKDQEQVRLCRQILWALCGGKAVEYACGELKEVIKTLTRFIVRKSSYQVYSYFCQCPSNGISISARLKEKVSAWGFCLEEFSILVKDTPDDQQWVVVHHIFSVEKTDFARVPVFLQHGMSGCSVDFLIDEESLGYALVSAGFDIWLGNVRGNRFSVTRDQACSPEMWDLNHWDHSWHEHAREDLPKMLTLVLKKTGHSCLDYVGHSMGTTMFFLMVSSYPEDMKRKIRTANLLAPVYDMKEVVGLVGALFKSTTLAGLCLDIMEFAGIHTLQFPKTNGQTSVFFMMILMIAGYHHLDNNTALEIASYGPSPVTIKTFRHFLQNHAEGGSFRPLHTGMVSREVEEQTSLNLEHKTFRKIEDNFSRFLRPTIQEDGGGEHPLSRVEIPVTLWYSDADWSGSRVNVSRMVSHLPMVKGIQRIETTPTYGHLDFLYGRSEEVYQEIINGLIDPEAETITEEQRGEVERHVEEITSTAPPSFLVLQLRGAKDRLIEVWQDARDGYDSAVMTVFDIVDFLVRKMIWEPAEAVAALLSGLWDWLYLPNSDFLEKLLGQIDNLIKRASLVA